MTIERAKQLQRIWRLLGKFLVISVLSTYVAGRIGLHQSWLQNARHGLFLAILGHSALSSLLVERRLRDILGDPEPVPSFTSKGQAAVIVGSAAIIFVGGFAHLFGYATELVAGIAMLLAMVGLLFVASRFWKESGA